MMPHLSEQMPASLSISNDATWVQSALEIDITFGIAEGGRARGKWRGGRSGGTKEVGKEGKEV
jgi:hypothetical protein